MSKEIIDIINQNDKYKGILIGLAMGDSLGAPYEFKNNKPYTGSLKTILFSNGKFGNGAQFDCGQTTDDTEMCLCIISSLKLENDKIIYDKDLCLKNYVEWANTKGNWGIGHNTRALFKGIKSIKSYDKRYEKMLTENPNNQSNGALMRCAILALLRNKDYYIQDCILTNPHPNCISTNIAYLTLIENLIDNTPIEIAIQNSIMSIDNKEVIQVIQDAINKKYRNVSENRGWCLHSLYLVYYCLLEFKDIKSMYKYVICEGGDTDTNAAIVGAAFGAYYGFKHIEEVENDNLKILLSCDTSTSTHKRDMKYIVKNYIL